MKDISGYLLKVQPESIDKPFDLTFLIDDANLDTGSSWDGLGNLTNSLVEYTSAPFEMTQTVTGLPKGTYSVVANAFQSPGAMSTACKDYSNDNNKVSAWVIATYGTTSTATVRQKLPHIYTGGQTERFNEGGSEIKKYGLFVPNNLNAARVYLNHDCYEVKAVFSSTSSIKSLDITLRDQSEASNYWTVIDGVKLLYYGTTYTKGQVTGIEDIEMAQDEEASDEIQGYYTISGVMIPQPVEGGITIIKYKDGHTKKIFK